MKYTPWLLMITTMLIGELAQKTKLSRHTIRFYEKLGLIEVPETARRNNNYKEYPEKVLRQIAAIQQIKSKGFTLKEAKGIIHLITTGTLDPERGKKYINHKVQLIEKEIAHLQKIRNGLAAMAEQCGSPDCDVNQWLNGAR
ncbi:MAG TPA: MerR family transcriptional regulator [Ohtaekwangia sp.]|nr:MerR family transcriptional regulator [Ohtaekwangia sp.]